MWIGTIRFMSKFRNFIFTHNNYENTVLEDTLECRFIAYSRELAPSTGTPHLQGYVCFTNPRTLSGTRKAMSGCHVEPMRGSISQNDVYISKMVNPVERGDKPIINEDKGRANALRFKRAIDAAKEGLFDQIDCDLYARYYSTWKRIREDHQPNPSPLDTSRPGIWIYGPTRTGKSHAVHTAYPDCYMKNNDKWWNGYEGQDIVYMEDFSKFDVKLGNYMKRWVDKWKFRAEVKGGSIMIRPKKIIVTSNYRIEDIWDDEITRDCLKNRFTVIEKLTKEQEILLL